MKKLLSVILSIIMACTCISCFTVSVLADGEETVPYVEYTYEGDNVYYISDNGDDKNDGLTPETAFKTLTKASLVFGDTTDCTLVVVDTLTTMHSIPACNLVGANSNSVIVMTNWRLDINGEVTINNINLQPTQIGSAILANGHKLVIGDNVTTGEAPGSEVTFPSLRGGGERSGLFTTAEVVVKSGHWHEILMGTRLGSSSENLHLTLYEDVILEYLYLSNSGDDKFAVGSSTVKIIGKVYPAITNNVINLTPIEGNIYLDLSEFEGEKTRPALWADIEDYLVITDPELVPEDALPNSIASLSEEERAALKEQKLAEAEAKKAAEEAAKKAEEEKKAAEEAAKTEEKANDEADAPTEEKTDDAENTGADQTEEDGINPIVIVVIAVVLVAVIAGVIVLTKKKKA